MLVMAVSWHDLRVFCEVVAVGFDSAEFILEKTRGILLFTSKVGPAVDLAWFGVWIVGEGMDSAV